MAKLNFQDLGQLTALDVASINKAIVVPTREAIKQLRAAITGNLTVKDNSYAAVMTLGYYGNSTQTLTHATEYTFQNPLKTKPIGFTPILSMQSGNVTALPVQAASLNTTRTDGLTGITLRFAPLETGSGSQGERVFSFVPQASAVTMNGGSLTIADITSITLTAGIWDIDFNVGHLIGTVVTPTAVRAWVNTASVTDPGSTVSADQRLSSSNVPTSANPVMHSIAGYRVTPATTTTYYFSACMGFSDGVSRAPQAFGRISAVRAAPYLTGYTAIVTGILWGG